MKELMNITNSTLNVKIQEIIRLENESRKNLESIAVILCEIEKNKMYALEGFKSTAEMAEKVLGYKKQTTSNMIKVAERFLMDEKTKLIVDDEQFGVSQYLELKPLTDTQIQDNLGTKLRPDMTTKALREAVNEIKGKKPAKQIENKSESQPLPQKLFANDKLRTMEHPEGIEPKSIANNTTPTATLTDLDPVPATKEAEATSDIDTSRKMKITFEFLRNMLSQLSMTCSESSDAGVKEWMLSAVREINGIMINRMERQMESENERLRAEALAEAIKEAAKCEVEETAPFEPSEDFAPVEESESYKPTNKEPKDINQYMNEPIVDKAKTTSKSRKSGKKSK